MDEEITKGYREQCAHCAAVNWGVSEEGQFFCKNCHNVIEKMMEVEDTRILYDKHNRISAIRTPKKKKTNSEREWMVCEAFQFILKHQAQALVNNGVCLKFESDILWNFWKTYLQNTRQAFTTDPVHNSRLKVQMNTQSDAESDSESLQISQNAVTETSDTEMSASVSCYSYDEASAASSRSLGSLGSSESRKRTEKVARSMTMPKTLALCYLALLWVREAITLSDLLRMVSKGCIPYLNIHEAFPSELTLYGREAKIFRVRYFPSYSVVHNEAVALAQIINLPSFPTLTSDCLLHPVPLSVRYLLEANLPDDLHTWVRNIIYGAEMEGEGFLTFDPRGKNPCLLNYDIQAVAAIIVALKLLFRLDDDGEWKLSEEAAKKNKKKVFIFKKWYRTVQPVLEQARQKEELEEAKRDWKASNPFISSLKQKTLMRKRRRVADHLQETFQRVLDQPSSNKPSYSTFRFSWGKEEGSDGPSMFNCHLDCTVTKDGVKHLANQNYWHPEMYLAENFSDLESSFPQMYVWILSLFSFILGIRPSDVHKEVFIVESRFLKRNYHPITPSPRQKKVKKMSDGNERL